MIKKISLIIIISLNLLIVITTTILTFSPIKIAQLEGISMSGINQKYVFHLAYVSDDLDLNRNDVIIFDPMKANISKELPHYRKIKTLNGETFTKRIIAFEGETIEIKDNQLFINDQPMIQEMTIEGFIGENMSKIKIPENQYFVAGDYRYDSLDSRYFGPIDKKSVIGKVITFDQPAFKKFSHLISNQMRD